MKKAHIWEMNTLKRFAEEDARLYINNACQQICKEATKEYKNILKQFIKFRQDTWSVIDQINLDEHQDKHQNKMGQLLAAQNFPVYDYRYRADPDSPFRLYDCLAPALKRHVRVPAALLPPGYLVDAKLSMVYHREKLASKKENARLL